MDDNKKRNKSDHEITQLIIYTISIGISWFIITMIFDSSTLTIFPKAEECKYLALVLILATILSYFVSKILTKIVITFIKITHIHHKNSTREG